jgi:hypothetical protein
VAGNSASIQIEGYIWIVMNSFSTAVVAIVAQNYGAGKKENIQKSSLDVAPFVDGFRPALGGNRRSWPISLCLGIFLTESGFEAETSSPQAALDAYNSAMEVGKERLMLIGLTYFLDGWMDNTSGFLPRTGPSEHPDHHHFPRRDGFPLGLHSDGLDLCALSSYACPGFGRPGRSPGFWRWRAIIASFLLISRKPSRKSTAEPRLWLQKKSLKARKPKKIS